MASRVNGGERGPAFQHRGVVAVSAIGNAAGSSVSMVEHAVKRALAGTSPFCDMEPRRARRWRVGMDPVQ